jgi:hypothetical protein
MTPKDFKVPMVTIQTMDCTANKKKFKLKLNPDKTYLFVTVIKMEERQYARMEIGPELEIELVREVEDLASIV